jgi:hypothetical protein
VASGCQLVGLDKVECEEGLILLFSDVCLITLARKCHNMRLTQGQTKTLVWWKDDENEMSGRTKKRERREWRGDIAAKGKVWK